MNDYPKHIPALSAGDVAPTKVPYLKCVANIFSTPSAKQALSYKILAHLADIPLEQCYSSWLNYALAVNSLAKYAHKNLLTLSKLTAFLLKNFCTITLGYPRLLNALTPLLKATSPLVYARNQSH